MAELLLELYSEEIPTRLQINARNQIKLSVENSLKEKNIKLLSFKFCRKNYFCRLCRIHYFRFLNLTQVTSTYLTVIGVDHCRRVIAHMHL